MKWQQSSTAVRWLVLSVVPCAVACRSAASDDVAAASGAADGSTDAADAGLDARVSNLRDGRGGEGAVDGQAGAGGMDGGADGAGGAPTGVSPLPEVEPGSWCPPLARPAHISIAVTGGVATYACGSAFSLARVPGTGTGAVSRVCQEDGTWSGTDPECVPIDCGLPPAPEHGTAQPSLVGFTKPGATAIYTCQSGYSVAGSAIRTCQLDGTWSDTMPACTELLECPSLTAPANGAVQVASRGIGSTATYSCNNGYELAGAVSRSCQNTLKWSGASPSCYAKPPPPRSCQAEAPGSARNCGGKYGTDDCCASPLVPGGTFFRDNDPVYPATVSDFRLDKYHVTVARFKAFVLSDAGLQKNHPVAGAGANPNIAGSGWRDEWTSKLPVDRAQLEQMLQCPVDYRDRQLYTYGNDRLPVACVDWYEAFAFCIWDGGRLPTELEWNYAAAGGDEQRLYPWGSQVPDSSYAIYANNFCGDKCADIRANVAPVGSCPKGNARWGHADLVGNMYQWVLDAYGSAYPDTCVNCAAVPMETSRITRGGCYFSSPEYLVTPRVGASFDIPATETQPGTGIRCARKP